MRTVRILIADDHAIVRRGLRALVESQRGYVLKSDADQNLIAAVEALLQHKTFLTSGVTGMFLSGPPGRNVTPREREIILLLAEGKSNKEVAAVLNVSTRTIETHRANIMHKLDINSLSALVRYAIRKKIVHA